MSWQTVGDRMASQVSDLVAIPNFSKESWLLTALSTGIFTLQQSVTPDHAGHMSSLERISHTGVPRLGYIQYLRGGYIGRLKGQDEHYYILLL